MPPLRAILFAGLLGLVPVAAISGQGTPPRTTTPQARKVPEAQRPPKGMCRVWMENVPASRQPAPTDCASAVRNRPPNARVIFPDDRGAEKGLARPARPPREAPRLPAKKDTGSPRRKPPADRPAH